MTPCSVDGCERKAVARGWCSTHWARWRTHGDPLVTLRPTYGQGKDIARHREAQARYRDRHREELRAKGRTYSTAHRARSNARRDADKAANPEKYRLLQRAYDAAHREQARVRGLAWRLANPERARENVRARRERLGGGRHRLPAGQWEAVLAAYGGRCAYCGQAGPLEQDHVLALMRGGRHTIHNVVPSCRRCNAGKGTGPPPVPVKLVLL